jgi:hypothetical protein
MSLWFGVMEVRESGAIETAGDLRSPGGPSGSLVLRQSSLAPGRKSDR